MNHHIDAITMCFLLIWPMQTVLWGISVAIKNASIVDVFWSIGILLCSIYGYWVGDQHWDQGLLLGLIAVWSLRLSLHIGIRNMGAGEDHRYQQFRHDFGPERYWWVSYFQVFLLQGFLMVIIALPVVFALAGTYSDVYPTLFWLGMASAIFGICFEAIADWQLQRFRKKRASPDQIMDRGLWGLSRHPNYFGEAVLWWGFGVSSIGMGAPIYVIASPAIMTYLLLKVSGVALLDRSLKDNKPKYRDYMKHTPAFVPVPKSLRKSSRPDS